MSSLIRRVTALEAAQPATVPDKARAAALRAAVGALLDAAESGTQGWNKTQSRRAFLHALHTRLEAGTATDGDRAMLAALPACHLPPRSLVWALCELQGGRK